MITRNHVITHNHVIAWARDQMVTGYTNLSLFLRTAYGFCAFTGLPYPKVQHFTKTTGAADERRVTRCSAMNYNLIS